MITTLKKGGAVTILISMLATAIAAIIYPIVVYFGRNAALVPEIQVEMRHFNKNMIVLTETAKETNAQLKAYATHHARNLAILTKAQVQNDYAIKEIRQICDNNTEDIDKCKRDKK